MQPEHSVANQDNDIRSDAKSEARGSSSLGLRLSGSDRTLKRASRRAGEQASKRASEQAGEHCWERSGIASGQPATPEPRTPEVAADRASPSEGALRCLSPITWEGPPHQQEELSRKSDPGFLALLVPGTKTGLRGLARRLPFDTRGKGRIPRADQAPAFFWTRSRPVRHSLLSLPEGNSLRPCDHRAKGLLSGWRGCVRSWRRRRKVRRRSPLLNLQS